MNLAPVYYTIVQVRFNPILALDSFVAKIQDRFRTNGFPDVQKGILTTFNLNFGASNEVNPSQVPTAQVPRYAFANIEKTSSFILEQASLSFQTTRYETFEKFSSVFLDGLKIVHEEISLDYIDRIGVRYLDAVFPKEGEQISAYLNESVVGLYGKIEGNLVHSFSETFVKNESINVVARTFIQSGSVGFPPDLQPIGVSLADRFQNFNGLHAVLDTDSAYDQRDIFDLRKIEARLSALHSVVSKAFKLTVTAHAIQVWE